jgi:hypothetical protein
MKLNFSEIKKEFEEFVRDGIPNEGFIVDSFHFSIPEKVENFFDLIANDIYIMHISLDTYISRKEKAEFSIEYTRNKPIGKYSELIDHLEILEKVKYKKFPRSFLYLIMNFLISGLSNTSKEIILTNRNIFDEYHENTLYITMFLKIKRFKFDFTYYGKIL